MSRPAFAVFSREASEGCVSPYPQFKLACGLRDGRTGGVEAVEGADADLVLGSFAIEVASGELLTGVYCKSNFAWGGAASLNRSGFAGGSNS